MYAQYVQLETAECRRQRFPEGNNIVFQRSHAPIRLKRPGSGAWTILERSEFAGVCAGHRSARAHGSQRSSSFFRCALFKSISSIVMLELNECMFTIRYEIVAAHYAHIPGGASAEAWRRFSGRRSAVCGPVLPAPHPGQVLSRPQFPRSIILYSRSTAGVLVFNSAASWQTMAASDMSFVRRTFEVEPSLRNRATADWHIILSSSRSVTFKQVSVLHRRSGASAIVP